MWWSSAALCVLLVSTLANGAEKQVKLQDIERDNLSSKQRSQKQYQQEQEEQQDQNISDQSGTRPDIPQTYISPEQQFTFQPQQQIFTYPQVPNVALYPAFLAPGAAPALQSNQLGTGSFLVPDYQAAALSAAYLTPQRTAAPASPLYYPQSQGIQLVYPGTAPVPQQLPQQTFVSQSPKASFTHQVPLVKHSVTPAQNPTFRTRGFQPPRPTSLDVQQSNFNPIPRELQSYTTIPDSVYQGREPAYTYDSAPAVSLTNDQQTQYNPQQQQQQRQVSLRPVFAPGVKNIVPTGQLKGNQHPPAGFAISGNVPGATRQFPSSGVSFSTFRRVPSSF